MEYARWQVCHGSMCELVAREVFAWEGLGAGGIEGEVLRAMRLQLLLASF